MLLDLVLGFGVAVVVLAVLFRCARPMPRT